ncbi:hypothetical protein [Pedobacter frigidisoli]|uniref:hypothetical protein n=1 Tax=Pedobacter frigidisoli TaxID=2530455 RepID=UPI00292F1ED6|nr:hypothetical protein [Pedobacter frigidisoli]
MKSLNKTTPIFVYLLVLLPFFSHASAYWMEIKGNHKLSSQVTVELIYGNIDELGTRHRQTGQELVLAGEFSFQLIDPKGNIRPLKMTKKIDCWSMVFLPELSGQYRIIGINKTHPVVDRSATGGESILPIDYLCGQYIAGYISEQRKPAQFLDLLVNKQGKSIIVNAFREDKHEKAKSKLRVFNPENWEKKLVVDENGAAVFYATAKGMYNIRLDWNDPTAGKYKGIAYTSIRHRCNYCLFIE